MSRPRRKAIAGEAEDLPRIRLSLQDLPPELIYHVATFLDTNSPDLRRLMQTCRLVSFAAEYHRYTSIIVSGQAGVRLMTTLISGTPTSRRYCRRVKCLWFRGWSDYLMYLSSTLLSQVLVRLENLITLWVESSPMDTTQLLHRMTTTGVIRENIHPSQLIPDLAVGRRLHSKLVLPALQCIRLTGDPAVSAFAYYRPLKELDLNFYLQGSHFAKFIEGVEGSILQRTLETLCIKLGRLVNVDLAFPILARALPSLIRLSIEQISVNFESILDHLAFNTELFPNLNKIVANRRFVQPIVVSGESLPKLYPISDVMEEYTQKIASHRPGFEVIGIGRTIWQLGIHGRFIKRTVSSYPDFWQVDFGDPFRLSRFDPRFLPNFMLEVVDNS